MNAATTIAPLQNYRIVGVTEKVHQPSPDAPARPGGSCWHCGTAIRVCVIAQNTETGEKVTIGTTCAERIGLDPKGLAASFDREAWSDWKPLPNFVSWENLFAVATGQGPGRDPKP